MERTCHMHKCAKATCRKTTAMTKPTNSLTRSKDLPNEGPAEGTKAPATAARSPRSTKVVVRIIVGNLQNEANSWRSWRALAGVRRVNNKKPEATFRNTQQRY